MAECQTARQSCQRQQSGCVVSEPQLLFQRDNLSHLVVAEQM